MIVHMYQYLSSRTEPMYKVYIFLLKWPSKAYASNQEGCSWQERYLSKGFCWRTWLYLWHHFLIEEWILIFVAKSTLSCNRLWLTTYFDDARYTTDNGADTASSYRSYERLTIGVTLFTCIICICSFLITFVNHTNQLYLVWYHRVMFKTNFRVIQRILQFKTCTG